MSDGLVKRLRTVDISWSEVGEWCAEAADRIRELESELAFYKGFHDGVCKDGTHVIVPADVRAWHFYPIVMPITSDGRGPARIGDDADDLTWEVYDRLYYPHASHDNLPDAINDAMSRTSISLMPTNDRHSQNILDGEDG